MHRCPRIAIAFGIGSLVGQTEEGSLMMIAGVVIALVDSVYRWKSDDGHWLLPERGGSLFFVPAWAIGIIWLALGIVYTLTPKL